MEKVSFFKCISGEQAILDTIQRGTAKLTQLSQSNDPMEFRPYGNEHHLQEWYKWNKGKQPIVLCLSSKFSSPPMWAHYADNHKGAAVVFDFDIIESYKISLPEELTTANGDFLYIHKTKQEHFLVKCVYCKNRSIVPKSSDDLKQLSLDINNLDRELILCIAVIKLIAAKGSEWAYENEYRLVFPENDLLHKEEEGLKRLITTKFQDNISAILVGYYNDFEERIKSCAKAQKKKLLISSVRCSSESFEMVCKQITDSVKKLEAIEQEAQLISWVELAKIML